MGEHKTGVTRVPAGRARGLGRPTVSTRQRSLVSIEVAPRSTQPLARPWEASGALDVERLASWAFADQRADRHAGVGLHSIEAGIDNVSYGARSQDGCGALADMEHLGCRIDRSQGIVRDMVHPVAEAVAALVHEVEGGELVRAYGRLGIRPDGWAERPRWQPLVWVKPGVLALAEREGPGRGPANVTRIICSVTAAEVERRRETYERWWEALDRLAWLLSTKRLGFTVLRPAAPARPWLEMEGGRSGDAR